MNRLHILLAAIIAMTLAPVRVCAQEETYKFDFGATLGTTGYLGEANESSIFKHPGIEGGLSFRYLINTRFAIRGTLQCLTLSGNTDDMVNVMPGWEGYKVNSTAVDLGARIECNFFAYGIGETYKRLKRWTPYLALGIGVTYATCSGQTAVGPNIPMAFGVKYKIKERWNLWGEFSMTKVFSDKLDGELKDVYMIESSFLKNTDWYSTIQIGVSYEFGKRCVTCHYVD